MKSNLFTGARYSLRDGSPIEDLRLGQSNMRALSAATGEINAWDRSEATRVISQLMQAVSSGTVIDARRADTQENRDLRQEHMEVLAAAFSDPVKWASLGSGIAMQLQEQRTREGFLRRLAIGADIKMGDVARISMTSWDALAVVANGPAQVGFQPVRSKVFTPPEFEIIANVRVSALDMQQVSTDLLDEAYTQAQDSLLVKEDRLFKKAADKTVGLVNKLEYIGSALTPAILGSLRNAVTDWGLPAKYALISNDYWADIAGNSDFGQWFDPVTKYDLVLTGYIGTLMGMDLITDGFRQPNQKVLNRGEIYVTAEPQYLAGYTDRGGITSTPTSGGDQGSTDKGWLLNEFFSFVLANPRAIVKGQRL